MHQIPQATFLDAADTVAECADAGEDDAGGGADFGGGRSQVHVSAERLERVIDTAHVAGSVVNQGDVVIH
jgi:hypothetical protein